MHYVFYDAHRRDGNNFTQLNKSHGPSIFKGTAMKTIDIFIDSSDDIK